MTVEHNVIATNLIHPMPGLGPYANEAARLAYGLSTATSADIGKCAFQTDTGALWTLAAIGSAQLWFKTAGPRPVKTDSTTARTISLSDYDALLLFTNAAAVTVTIPLNSSVAFPIGTEIQFYQSGAGQVTLTPASGVTLATLAGLATKSQGAKINALKIGADTWNITGDLSSAAFSGNFASLISSVSVLQYLRSDLGLGVTGSVVNSWADQSGNSHNVSEGTSTVGIGGVTTGLNGHAGIASNGSTQFGKYTQFETVPYWIWWVGRLLATPSAAAQLFGDNGGSAGNVTFATPSSNNLYINNGATLGPLLQTTNQWIRGEALFANAGADYLKTGSSTSSVGSAGSTAGGGPRGIFARGGSGAPVQYELLARMVLSNAPTSGEKSALDAAVTSFYGGTVQV